MFCPRCGSNQSEDLRFCKSCGANLFAIRQVVDSRDTEQNFDWSKTWVAEMFMSGEEAARRQEEAALRHAELQRQRGVTPATRRIQEMKAGVITVSAGLGVAVFLAILMQGIILSGEVSDAAAEILSRIWVVGIIPVLVGIALIINGYFLSKKLVERAQNERIPSIGPEEAAGPQLINSADTTEFIAPPVSVTEGTTKHLGRKLTR